MFDPQVQQQHRNSMSQTHVEHHHHHLPEISMEMTSSKSDFGMRNTNEGFNGNEKVVVEVEAPPSAENQQPMVGTKKKGYSRHTKHQIQEMESFFARCPHPNEMQRRELGRQINLKPSQIQFWFQNKHTQIKSQDKLKENKRLKAENERIIAENQRYKEALSKTSCGKYGSPTSDITGEMSYEEQRLRIENGRLKAEIARILGRSINNVGSSMTSFSNIPSQSQMLEIGSSSCNYGAQSDMKTYSSGGAVVRPIPHPLHNDKSIIVELAMAAMEELTMLAASGPPLWILGNLSEILNLDEYMKAFPIVTGPKLLGCRTEASRESIVVIMNHINLIEILMDVNQWSNMFSDIVTRGMTLEVLSTGVAGTYNGAIQVMSAEYQIPSPLAHTRDNYFVRYCKHQQDGTWVVVDVSLDHLLPSSILSSRRRPSGCVIQELPNGHSKVTWVEHVDVDDQVLMMHNHFRPLVNSCVAFGAKRWLASLDRHCERLASAMEINIPFGDLSAMIMNPEGRKSMLRLAERVMASFCASVGASKAHVWTPTSLDDRGDDIKVMTRNSNNEPDIPCGIVLSVATSFRLPITPKRVFEFLRDNNRRSQWDMLSIDGIVHEMAHIASGRDPGNCISLLSVMNNANTILSNTIILQESFIDSIGSYLVYAPIDVFEASMVLSGADPNFITLLPSGFAILPDGDEQFGPPISNVIGSAGSMLTVAFQILVDTNPMAKPSPASVAMITNLIKQSIGRIKVALLCASAN